MNAFDPSVYDRVLELLSLRAAEGLTPEQARELAMLLREHPEIDQRSMDEAAAAALLGALREEGAMEAVPERVASRALASAPQNAGQSAGLNAGDVAGRITPTSAGGGASRNAPRGAWAGWAIAALLTLVAAVGWWPRLSGGGAGVVTPGPMAQETPGELRERLLAQATARRAEFPAGGKVTGDVVWDDTTNEGVVRLRGLTPNDAAALQYQLWVFDPTRSNPDVPVHAGVFDVAMVGEDILIKIRPSLPINAASAFAVSQERRGGSVTPTMDNVVGIAPVNR